jgi:hypothetical protein
MSDLEFHFLKHIHPHENMSLAFEEQAIANLTGVSVEEAKITLKMFDNDIEKTLAHLRQDVHIYCTVSTTHSERIEHLQTNLSFSLDLLCLGSGLRKTCIGRKEECEKWNETPVTKYEEGSAAKVNGGPERPPL